MAGNRINTKTKTKDDKNKGSKSGSQPNDVEEPDFSLLRKPILTSVTGFAVARKIFDVATEELKSLLSSECDVLYECKVCRNIFRSLANFLTHKRIYCKEKFSRSKHSHFLNNSSAMNEIMKIQRMEEQYQSSLSSTTESGISTGTDDSLDRIPMTKDVTTILENLTKVKGVKDCVLDEVQQVTLQKIPNSSVAVFQNTSLNESVDQMRTEVREIEQILSKDCAVLQKDGKFKVESSLQPAAKEENITVIQISDDEEENDNAALKCKICNLQFSTMKTLKFHMKYKHLESRLVYPCPDCVDIFSTSWSVYRHLFKVHRKSAAQIRRLRESIQAKSFRMNNPPASYEKRKNMKPAVDKKLSDNVLMDQDNHTWVVEEGGGCGARCGGCGRGFERRAALAAHQATCRGPAHASANPANNKESKDPRAKRIQIQVRRDYNKAQPASAPAAPEQSASAGSDQPTVPAATTVPAPPPQPPVEENTPAKDDANTTPQPQDENSRSSFPGGDEESTTVLEEGTMTIPQIQSETKNDDPSEKSAVKTNDSVVQGIIDRPASKIARDKVDKIMNNMAMLRQKIQSRSDADLENSQCKKCDLTFETTSQLCNHMAEHYNWMRFACKLCNVKNYYFEKLSKHVKTVHKLKGDMDFYHSTVKAIDGNEALELCDDNEEDTEDNDTSPNSRRPSRCSSDSSRLSDDSNSNSSTAKPDSSRRKRKMPQSTIAAKKKREDKDENDYTNDTDSMDKVINVILGNNESKSDAKSFEENSSDLDDIEDKISKRMSIEADRSIPSTRPVRKRTKPKNEDYEYDLSNLLKMEAQGYREYQSTSTKSVPNKKKPQIEVATNEILSKNFTGALQLLSKMSVASCKAHLKPLDMSVFSVPKEIKTSYPFAKPYMLPKNQNKQEKSSPKKDVVEEKDTSSNNTTKPAIVDEESTNAEKEQSSKPEPATAAPSEKEAEKVNGETSVAVLPIRVRPPSIDLIKNPIRGKNISDFAVAGKKTKILLIKPVNRLKEGIKPIASQLKFQTIKLKDPSKYCMENKPKSDQVLVVKVPNTESNTETNSKETVTADILACNETLTKVDN